MTHLRQKMLDELQRRNYSQNTIKTYLHAVEEFSRYFHRSPDRLGPDHIRQYQAYLFRERRLQAGTIALCTAALRFLYVKTLRRPYLPKAPFGGSEHVLNYLARYTHRVAISNHRLVAFENDRVSFRWRDYAHGGKQKVMTLTADQFLRRFLLHMLPKGLVRIRHFGLFANRRRETALARCRELLGATTIREQSETTNLPRCPACSATTLVIERFTSAQLYFQPDLCLATPQRCSVDSS